MTLNSKFIRLLDKYLCWVLCRLIYYLRPSLRARCSAQGSDPQEIKRILLIKFPGIGNIIMLLPLMKAIREHFPSAEITFFTLRRNQQILKDNPFIDRQLFLWVNDGIKFLMSVVSCAVYLLRNDYDYVIDFEQFSKTSSFFVSLTRARERIGFDIKGHDRAFVYSVRVPYIESAHMVDIFATLLSPMGIAAVDTAPIKLPVSDMAYQQIDVFCRRRGIPPDALLIGIHPGTGDNFGERKWPHERFAALAEYLIEKYHAVIYFTGSGSERRLIRDIAALMHHTAIDTSGKLSLPEIACLIERSRFFVANDTALLHLACAMGTPVVGLYGPNTPALYGPRGEADCVLYHRLWCSPCITNQNQKSASCRNPICMRSLSVREICEAIDERFFSCEKRPKSTQTLHMGMHCGDPRNASDRGSFLCPLCDSPRMKLVYDNPAVWYPLPFGRVFECRDCAGVFKEVLAHTKEELYAFYDESYIRAGFLWDATMDYLQTGALGRHDMFDRIMRLTEAKKHNGALLIIGSGTGIHLDYALRQGWQSVRGVEVSSFAASYAREHFNANIYCGDIYDAALDTASCDVIVITETIEHMPHPVAYLQEVGRLLKDDGLIFIITQNRASSIFGIAHVLYQGSGRRFLRPMNHVYDNCHIFFFEPKTLRSVLARAGLKVHAWHSAGSDSRRRRDRFYSLSMTEKAGVIACNTIDRFLGRGYRMMALVEKDQISNTKEQK